jgi:RNA polymerase sigma factor (sigma-70 family)
MPATVTGAAAGGQKRYSQGWPISGGRLNTPETNDFQELFDARVLEARFLARLRWFATRWLGDAHAGEDAAQEALKRVLQALAEGRVKQPEALPAFVYQTARHVCSHHHRAAGRERRMLTGYGTERSLDEPAPDPLNELVSEARIAEVRGALAAMDEEDRDLLSALYIHERSPEQLAAELQLSGGALRTRKHRALKRLSQHLVAGEMTG